MDGLSRGCPAHLPPVYRQPEFQVLTSKPMAGWAGSPSAFSSQPVLRRDTLLRYTKDCPFRSRLHSRGRARHIRLCILTVRLRHGFTIGCLSRGWLGTQWFQRIGNGRVRGFGHHKCALLALYANVPILVFASGLTKCHLMCSPTFRGVSGAPVPADPGRHPPASSANQSSAVTCSTVLSKVSSLSASTSTSAFVPNATLLFAPRLRRSVSHQTPMTTLCRQMLRGLRLVFRLPFQRQRLPILFPAHPYDVV